MKKPFLAILIAAVATGAGLPQTPARAWEVYRGPVSPAIAPGLPGASSQHGENSFRVEADRPCVIRKPDGTTQVVVLRHIVSTTQASHIHQKGGSAGLSFFSWGVSGSISDLKVTPNPPVENFDRYLQLTEAGQVISCEAASDPKLHNSELRHATHVLTVLRRGRVTGFAASEQAQQAYLEARRKAGPYHPKLAAADAAAAEGRYEDATSLLTTH